MYSLSLWLMLKYFSLYSRIPSQGLWRQESSQNSQDELKIKSLQDELLPITLRRTSTIYAKIHLTHSEPLHSIKTKILQNKQGHKYTKAAYHIQKESLPKHLTWSGRSSLWVTKTITRQLQRNDNAKTKQIAEQRQRKSHGNKKENHMTVKKQIISQHQKKSHDSDKKSKKKSITMMNQITSQITLEW